MTHIKIKIHEHEVVIVQRKFETTDGIMHVDYETAADHQRRIDGDRITCDICHGSKGRMDWQDEDGYKPKKWFPCKKCTGKGYLDKIIEFK